MAKDVVSSAIAPVCAGETRPAAPTSPGRAEIMEGRTEPIQTGAFLIALRAKGETVSELVGLARTMRALAAPVHSTRADLVDTAGPAGAPSTFNVSTTAALVAAGAGCAVAKHGNRSATSKSGSADVLEALGGALELDPAPEAGARCIDEVGFGFMLAPRHHQATSHVRPAREGLGVRTVFNFLGPLTNPAGATRQLVGVADRYYQETIAEALIGLGVERALVVSAEDGVDELALSATTRVIEVFEGRTAEWFVNPGQYGLAPLQLSEIAGGTPEENAAATRAVLAGESGPHRDIVLLNAAAAIYVGGLAADLEEGGREGRTAIDSGAAASVLDQLIAATVSAAG